MTTVCEQASFASDRAALAGYVWRPAREVAAPVTVVMAHGLTNSHSDAPLFGVLRDRLLKEGMSVFMFDFFGSGESDGAFQDKTWANQSQNLADAIDFVRAEVAASDESLALFGRSVGGTLCGFFATHPAVRCSVLASPPFLLEETFGGYRSRAADGYVHMPEDLERSGQIRGEWKLPVAFFEELVPTERALADAVRGARRVMVSHGLKDPKVSPRNAEELYALLAEPRRYCPIAEADHYYHDCEDEIVGLMAAWIAEQTEVAS